MRSLTPGRMILIGFVCVLVGFLLPLFMILGMIPSTFALNFLSYTASFAGLILGIIGSAFWVRGRRRRDEDE